MSANQLEFTRQLSKQATSPKKFLELDFSRSSAMSERVVEVPWAASWLTKPDRIILDVGIAMSSPEHLDLLINQSRNGSRVRGVDIIDPVLVLDRLNPSEAAFLSAAEVVVGDISSEQSPIGRDQFDIALCISTLEHIGFDTPRSSDVPGVFERALRPEGASPIRDSGVETQVLGNIRRALKPNGMLLLSVPYGSGESVLLKDSLGLYTYQQEYGPGHITDLVNSEGFVCEQVLVYGNVGSQGWSRIVDWEGWHPTRRANAQSAAACALLALRRTS